MKPLLAIIFCLLQPILAFAQNGGRIDVFGGFSFLTFDCSVINCRGTNPGALPGWNTEVTGFVTHALGLTADVGGYYRSFNLAPPPEVFQDHVSQYTVLFGPTVRVLRGHKGSSLFAHALFGAGTSNGLSPISLTNSHTDRDWAMAIGGGTSLNVTKTFGIQLSYDWVRTNNYSQAQNRFRFSGGMIVHLPWFGNR